MMHTLRSDGFVMAPTWANSWGAGGGGLSLGRNGRRMMREILTGLGLLWEGDTIRGRGDADDITHSHKHFWRV